MSRMNRCAGLAWPAASFLLAAVAVHGAAAAESARAYSPAVAHEHPRRVLFGDLHLHTQHSADAFSLGTQTVSMIDAYDFARGQTITTATGQRARLRRPLDFLAITDHAEYLSAFHDVAEHLDLVSDTDLGRRWAALLEQDQDQKLIGEMVRLYADKSPELVLPESYRRFAWTEVARTADRYNAPGVFTTLIGYEWTSTVQGNNLHRVVIFADDATRATQQLPFSVQDSDDPEDLWSALEQYERRTGGHVLAIPHNGNLSNGLMFAESTFDGSPMSADYAHRRARWEPLAEVTQVKGDGETHPALSPTDEFADFERWDEFNITMTARNEPWMLKYEYARSALGLGLALERQLGANPFRFGMVGGTDSHTGMTTTTEDNFFGKFPSSEPSRDRMAGTMAPMLDIPSPNWSLVASGLTGVWAMENTRASVFEALKRREVYATTGTRIRVRFFGSWDFPADAATRPEYATIGYERGVPMGGELAAAPAGARPNFIAVAAKDPDEANLDRIQIVKVWIDRAGAQHERIFDVALSDGRKVDRRTGKAPSVGTTVDIPTATYRNTIGDPELSSLWSDPEFDPALPALYYVRVIEIPTPRWTAHDAAKFGVAPPEGAPLTTTKRAYTSPIWYRPD
jgi:hypothetical protein